MEVARDIIGSLLLRNMAGIVEDILYLTDAATISSCYLVCRCWRERFDEMDLWRRMVDLASSRDKRFLTFCSLNNAWIKFLPRRRCEQVREAIHAFKTIHYKMSALPSIISSCDPRESYLFSGSLISCLKMFKQYLFAGLLDGAIKMWIVGDPVRNEKPRRVFEGHHEEVTSLDAAAEFLASSSLDHSVRIWNIGTGGLVRVLSGAAAPLTLVRLFPKRIIAFSTTNYFSFWFWNGPKQVDFLYSISAWNGRPSMMITGLALDEPFLVLLLTRPPGRERGGEVHVYSSSTGRRLPDKTVRCCDGASTVAVFGRILCLGYPGFLEVWSLEDCSLLNTVHTLGDTSLKELALSDFLLVVIHTSGAVTLWSLCQLVVNRAGVSPLLVINNKEPSWKNITFSDHKLAVGLEKRFGDIKIFSFTRNTLKNYLNISMEESAHERVQLNSLLNDSIPDLK